MFLFLQGIISPSNILQAMLPNLTRQDCEVNAPIQANPLLQGRELLHALEGIKMGPKVARPHLWDGVLECTVDVPSNRYLSIWWHQKNEAIYFHQSHPPSVFSSGFWSQLFASVRKWSDNWPIRTWVLGFKFY